MYSKTVRRLVAEMPNSGDLPEATHSARGENPVCGDVVRFDLWIVDAVVRECAFKASGCPAAIASAAAVTLLCRGKPVKACLELGPGDLTKFLEGLPPHKLHAPQLAIEALRRALGSG